MSTSCNVSLDWRYTANESPIEHKLLFFVTAGEPDICFTGKYVDGRFFIQGQNNTIIALFKGTNVVRFAYVDTGLLNDNNKESATSTVWHDTTEEVPSDKNPVAIYPCFKGNDFAIWNSYDNCWDDETGDDFLCHKESVKKWYAIPWNQV